MPPSTNQGITRRDILKKGAVLGGAVVWVTPIVQSVGMGRAFAQAVSPCMPPISYIAMNVTCDGDQFFIKWEGDEFLDFEFEPGNTPDCPFTMNEDHVYGGIGGLGFEVDPQPDGTHIITVGPGCTVELVAVKGGQECDVFAPPSGGSFPVSCPGLNPI
jgi:hypothetical protein